MQNMQNYVKKNLEKKLREALKQRKKEKKLKRKIVKLNLITSFPSLWQHPGGCQENEREIELGPTLTLSF